MNRNSRSLAKPVRRLPLKPETALPALTTLAMVIGSLASGGANANPTGGNVVGGAATIIDRGNGTLDINQSTGKAIINWKDFSIGANETVNFRQPGGKSVTLNRVVGNDPSAIFGKLNANGTVMLVNPNGVVFGKGARIDVGGLVATTANINDKDFLAGNYKFNQASTKAGAAIINEGTISIKDSGLAALVAPSVRNSGVIEAKLGRVALAGAKTFTVDFQGDGLLSFDATSTVNDLPKDANGKPVSALVTNTGTIVADGGTVLMTARAVKGVIDNVVNTDGIISAKTVGTQNGKIVLSGGDAGTVKIAGKVDATGAGAGQQGGKVVVTGEHVDVTAKAAIDVSGAAGGGEIALGSLGVAPDNGSVAFSNKSSTVKVAAGATLKADAQVKGNGGSITMWSNEATAFAGSLSARGGEQGGDGGFAEVSSMKNIGLTGSVDLRAPKGKTGLLLIDPTDLRIVDSNSGGALDGPASDGTISAGDANAANNTVSRGLLESLAGNANIKLEATGQITIADMAAINLKTTSGNSFTLRSTQTGGIRFENSNTEISTQGGAITLEALGVGSTLNNIGKLTSRGGAITLNATGDINLANVIDAGAGAALVRTSAGSIRNTGGANQVVAGGTVTLDASGGSIGEAGNAVNTQTTRLALATGGNLAVANRSVLTSLDVTSRHAQPGVNNTFDITSTGLMFAMADNGGYQLQTVDQSGLNFSFTGDRSITVGNIGVGMGAVSLTSTAGDILARAGANSITAGSLTLKAAGSTGGNGAIGAAGQALNTLTPTVTATSGSGGVYLNNGGSLALRAIDTTGPLSVSTTGNLTLGNIRAGSGSTLTSLVGNIVDDGDDATTINTSSLTLSAETGSIGTVARALKTNASSVSATAGRGGVYLDSTSTNLNITQAQADAAAIVINGAGSVSANNVSSGGGAVNLTGNSIFAGEINAGSGNVTLTARAGSITGNSASLITGNVVTLLAPAANSSYTVGTAGTYLRTAAGELRATGGSIYINQAAGSVLLDDLKAFNGIAVTGVADLTANMLDSGAGPLTLNAQGGSILRANANSELAGSNINLQALQHIGTSGGHIKTATTSLSLTSGGDIYVDNPSKTLTYLSVANSHADPSRRNTLLVSAPFLNFDINDDLGVAYELKQVYSSLLNQFVFRGDQNLKLGNIRGGSSVSLTSTLGSILDDGDINTRVTANNVSLTANQDIGTSANFVAVNAAGLTLDTRGNLYATSIADLNSLTVYARHKDVADTYVLDVRAPSLLFNITDTAAGHVINEVRDSNSLNFNFTSDRDITVGSIDAGSGGSIYLNASGAIRDDGNKNTTLLANSINLVAGKAVGATGTGYLDLLTTSLSGTANDGGFFVRLLRPAGSSNTTSIISLNNITATEAVQIDARQGDLLTNGTVRSWNDDVTVNAANGSILSSGGGVYAGGGDILLTATGSIGGLYAGSLRTVGVGGVAGTKVVATAGGDVYMNGTSTDIKLDTVTAGGLLSYTQSSGTTTVGSLQANGSATLVNSSGSILDDGDAATKIQASSISLTAGSVLGAAGAALTLQAPDVTLTSGSNIYVDNLAGLNRLNITRTGTAVGTYSITAPNLSAFTLTDDASGIHLKDLASATNLDFGLSAANKNVYVGNIDAGAGGTVSLLSGASIANDDVASPGAIRAATVSLTAGSNGSIGASGAGGALVLNGTSALNLTAGNSFYVGSDTVLRSVAINSLRSAGQTSTIAITGGAGQVFNITDDGTTQYLQQVSGGLTDFSFSGRKNIQVGALTASNSVSLTTAGGGVYSSITSDTGTGRITSNSLTLSATGSDNYTARDPNTGALGSTSRVLRTSTSNLKITNNGDIFLHNGGLALSSADLYLSRRDAGSSTNFDVNAYSFGGLGGQSLAISGGTSLAVGANMSGASLSINADSAIVSNTINTGATGSVTLTSRYANTSFAPTISGSGLITGNNVSLNALTTNGSVSAQTSANNLSIGSAGNVAVANNKALTSLALTANHASTSGSIANSYSISASGLTFSVSDSTGTAGLTLNNVTSTGNLALSLSSDRTLTVNNVTTAAGGSVTLSSNGNIYGNSSSASSPNITTGALTLNAGSVTGTYLTNQPLYTSVDSLSSNIRGSLWLSNNKTLTLNNNSAASSAQVNVTNGSILQDTGTFVAPSLTLTATQSIGAAGNAVQTDTRMLTTQTGKDLYLNNASDLFSLNVRATHANAALDNVLQVAAKGLTFDVTDSGVYSLNNVRDVTGVNFTFSGDRTIYIGNIDTGPAQNVSISAEGSGSNILNLTPTSHITGDSVQLFATGQIGVASGDNSGSIHTTTSELYLTGGSHMYVDNDRDLASLSLYATGGNASTYQIRSNELLFDVAHNGSRLLVNEVRDNTGLNLSVSSSVGQDIGIIDTTPTGTVRLSSNNSILGSADDTQRITASQVSITTQGAGGIGAVGREINLSAPIVNIQNAGDVYIDSDTHIDSLSLYSTGNGARNYAINSPTRDGGNIGFIATDGGSGSTAGLVLTNITDTGGLNLSVTSDRTITAGTINVGFDNVSLTSRLGSLLGDGDATTKIDAASLSLTANNAIGAAGTGNAIDTRVSTLNGRASNGGAFITVEGNTSLPSLTSTGASSVSNTVGDIELGSVNTNGNAFTVNNTGGSILSGTISNATTVNLTANGSIGNKSAIRTTNISGGTTIVTLSANKTATADGSIALIETYGLRAASVTADGNITLTSDTGNGARDLVVGTISTTGGAVSLSANYGNIVGADNSNRITGNSVTLTATQGTNRTLGTSGTRLHLDTPSLTLNTPGSIYVDNLADLTDLTINRANGQGSQLGSAGALSISAQNLTFSGTDSGNVTTLTTVRDTTGLNFTYQAIGAINLNQIDVTQNGSVNLSTNPYYYTGGAIQGVNNSSKITAGDLTLSTSSGDTTNSIGSSSRALNTQVKNISATASGGIWLSQTGSINLGNLRAGEDLSVTTTTGDILVGSVSYGTNKTLTLNAQTGSILDGGGVISGSGNGAISLTARNGIGTNDAAIKISAPNNPVSATVTGAGSLFLDSTNNLLGGLTTSVANGETRVTSSGNIVLTSMTSGTDATGNGISVKTTSGNITVKNVQAGTTQGQITLNAENGYILADAAGATIKAYGVALNARSGIGANSTLGRINATGQRVEATTNGAMYLAADNNSVYSYLSGNVIDIAAAGNLQIANAIAANGNGTIRIVGNGTNSQLVAGNIDAGAGSVNIDYSKAGSTIVDDREESTRIIGNFVTLKAAAGIGGAEGSADNVQTTAASITAEVTGNGAIYLDDNRAAGTTLSSIITNNGAIGITTAGNTVVSSAITKTSSANNDISIATSNGDLYINTIDAMPLGDVTLSATGSILGALSANLIYGNSLTATAGGSIGSATNLADGSGGIALRTNLASLGNLSTGADGAVIVLNNVGTRALTLNGNVTQTGDNSSVYLRSSGDLDARSGLANTADNVLLSSGGLLTVASAGVQANDTVTLIGSRDVVAAGATPRTITVNGDTLNFSSGSAGGNTVLTTQVANANASLTGITAPANLTLNNTGDLTAALYTANGNIKAKTTGALDVSATADGNNRTIDLTAEQGDLSFGLINAGAANGAVILSAADGSLLGQGTDLIANSLDLTSKNGIGAANSPFMISARNLTANVLGAGDINVQGISALTLGQIATTDGSIKIKSFSNLVSGTKLSAGNGGDVLLGSTAGNVTVSHAIASGDASNLTVDGLQITVAAVDTTGAQTYNGNVVLNGDLTGTSININGGAQLAGGKRTLTANGASGGVSITGALNGGAQQAVIVAQDGDVTLGDNATNLASLTIDGANIDLHQVATTGAQQYNGNTTLRGTYTTTNGAFGVDGVTTLDNAVNVATGNGAVTFTGDVNGLNALTVTSSGGTTYGGAVNIGSLNQAGTGVVALNGGGVNTLGMQNYAGRVLLGDDTTLTGSTISLGNGADGAYALDINGAATLAGAIGANTKLASLTLNGTATLNTSSIATTGNQHYTQVVTLGSNQSLSTTTGDVTFDNALEGAGRNVAINSASGGDVSLNTVGNANQRLGSITINTAGETSFNGEVYAASVQTDAPGTVAINASRIDTTGTQSYGELVTLGNNATLKGSTITLSQGMNAADESLGLTIDGNAVIDGAVGAGVDGRLAGLVINGTAQLAGGVINTVGAQAYQGNVTLADDLVIRTGGAAGSNVSFNGTVASSTGEANDLTINAGLGNVTLARQVGDAAGARLGALAINSDGTTQLDGAVYAASVTTDAGGTLALNGSLVDTSGTQSYGELAVLGANTVLKGSTVTLAQGADSVDETQGLTIDGNAVVNGALGAGEDARLASLTITGAANLNGGLIDTVGAQSYQGNVTLSDDLDIQTANANVTFGAAVASAAGAANALTVNAGSGNVNVVGAMGDAATARLGDVRVNSSGATTLGGAVYAASVTTDAGGTLAINGGRVDTTGTQSYGELAVLGADTVLKGSSITLAQGANGTDETQDLTIDGDAVINGAVGVGANARLASLTVTGKSGLAGGTINTVGAQSYQGDVTLSDDLVVNTSGAAGSNVSFGGAVASSAGDANALTINAGLGNVTLAGQVGDAADARLGALAINSNGATKLDGAVYAASVTTDAGGTLAINGGLVDTTGTQTYGELAVLGADTVLKGSTVTLAQGADSVDETQGLTIDGNAVVNGALGGGNDARLASLTITGDAELGGGTINTVGAQSYQGNVTLTDDLDSQSANGDVTFGGTLVSSAQDGHGLSLATGTGNVTFSGAVGDDADGRLGDISIASNGATTLNGPVYAASISSDVGGTLAINGGLVDTTGTQTYGELAVLGGDTVLKGSTVSLLGGGDGKHDLTIDGDAVLKGTFGGQDALASLTITGKSTLDGNIATTGDQTYQGEVTLDGDVTLGTQGGNVAFNDKLASSQGDGHGLSLNTGSGDVTFSGPVGDDADGRLGDITIASNGATTLNGPVYAASISSDVGGTLAINGGLVDTTGTQSYGERAVLGGDTVLKGSTVSLLGGGDGEHDLTIDGDAVLKGPFGAQEALASLTVTGKSTLGEGSINTTGDQSYQGAVTLDGNVVIATRDGDIGFDDSVDGSHDLTVSAGQGDVTFSGPVGQDSRLGNLVIAAAGDTVLDGPVRAGTLQTSGNGDLLINGGSIDTTGTQQYGQHIILGALDTTLTGTNVQIQAGVDGTNPGEQGLVIAGNADIQGDVGGTTPLRGLAIDGTTTMGPGKVNTTGDQVYTGAVTLTGDRELTSSTGSIIMGSTLDGGNGNNLAINAGKNVQVAGDATGLGALTLRAVDTIVFNGDVSAYRVQQLEAKSASYNGAVRATGPDGIDISGGSVSFGKDVTADTGPIRINNTDPAGTTTFAAGTTVKAATGFTQTGGAGLTLPAQLLVTQGPISLGAPAKLQGANATISTNGDITAVGLSGPQTSLTLASGPLGALRIGLNDADPSHKLDVAELIVPTAGSADLWGTIGGKTGPLAAASIKSSLVGSPFYLNGFTWGPTDTVNRLSAITAPRWVIPSTPTADSLFRGTVPSDGFGPNPLGAYSDPQVLKVVASNFAWQFMNGGDNTSLAVPSSNGPVLQTPGSNSQKPVVEGTQSSDDERRDNDAQSRTL